MVLVPRIRRYSERHSSLRILWKEIVCNETLKYVFNLEKRFAYRITNKDINVYLYFRFVREFHRPKVWSRNQHRIGGCVHSLFLVCSLTYHVANFILRKRSVLSESISNFSEFWQPWNLYRFFLTSWKCLNKKIVHVTQPFVHRFTD
jgi:hypothetical protein